MVGKMIFHSFEIEKRGQHGPIRIESNEACNHFDEFNNQALLPPMQDYENRENGFPATT